LKSPVSFSFKSFLLSAALSLGVSALVAAAWGVGVLASPAALFMFDDPATPSVPPQAWVVLLLVAAAGLGGGFAAERLGARRASLVLACALAVLCAASLLVSRFLHLDIVFAPMMFASFGSLLTAQARRLWKIDSLLTENVERLAVRRSALEGRGADGRLLSGLRLLSTVLPLEEAVIFRLDEWGAPVQAARLRAPARAGARDDGGSNSAWREGVRVCERVMRSRELEVKAEPSGGDASTVAVPLCHDGQAVGALLLRLRGRFDEDDRPLLENVSAQFARNLQRDDARALDVPRARATFFSSRAARQRLEAFGVVSGLLTEQGFAGLVLSEGSDAHAVAYLDGTLAFVNPAMRASARLGTAEWRKLDLFSLLERFRTGVFDEPQIAVRRVLQTGQVYERDLTSSTAERRCCPASRW